MSDLKSSNMHYWVKIIEEPAFLALYKQGMSDKKIARELGVTPQAVQKYRKRRGFPVNGNSDADKCRNRTLDGFDWEVVLEFAKNNMNAAGTARKMFMHRNSVMYHLLKVKRVTGLDPLMFFDLVKLVKNIGGAEDG